MKKPEPKYEEMEMPRLSEEIKEMNGKSTKRFKECIDALTDIFDKDPEQNDPPE